MKHAILLKPNTNIPYFEEMKKMCFFELQIVLNKLNIEFDNMNVEALGLGYYLSFETEEVLDESALSHIKNLSFYYAYFQCLEGMLKPVDIELNHYFTEDLSNRLKYSGKTNEAFTAMMLNLALYASDFDANDTLCVFDPVCGRGTTLFEAMIRGHHGFGSELNKKSVGELSQYFQRYLKEGKYKHQVVRGRAIHNKKTIGETFEASIGINKEEVKKKTGKQLKVFRGDTTESNLYFKKQSMHVIVGDLPYGVQHMSKHEEGQTRNLEELLKASFKSWYSLLKKGGALALSWNTYTNTRQELKAYLEEYGYQVVDDSEYMQFHHRVSQAINRDIIVAVKK